MRGSFGGASSLSSFRVAAAAASCLFAAATVMAGGGDVFAFAMAETRSNGALLVFQIVDKIE